MHVGVYNGGHLTALHLRDTAFRVQNEDIEIVTPAESMDRRRASIARGGTDDGNAALALAKKVVEEAPEQLQR